MGIFFAWAVGEGIIAWRWIKNGAPPTPGALLLPTALYLSVAILAEYPPARTTATAFAWAVDLAILLQIVGKAPAQATGWPPPKMLDTQIWPGGASAAASPATAPQSAASKAASGSNLSGEIINAIEDIPGLGIIK
jgi:hypothetical protein